MMKTATKRHLYVSDYPRFAEVTVGQSNDPDELDSVTPVVRLSGSQIRESGEKRDLVASATDGIKEAESECEWAGAPHVLLSIEGLLVDGIDAKSARIAAALATKELMSGK